MGFFVSCAKRYPGQGPFNSIPPILTKPGLNAFFFDSLLNGPLLTIIGTIDRVQSVHNWFVLENDMSWVYNIVFFTELLKYLFTWHMKTFLTKKSLKGPILGVKCVQTFFSQMATLLKFALSMESIRKLHWKFILLLIIECIHNMDTLG